MAAKFCFWLSITLILFPIASSASFDTITALRPLHRNQTIVSAGQVFELGFFTSGSSYKWYVGIWYKQVPNKTIVWVANRDNPLTSSTGVLKIGPDGNLIIAGDDPKIPLWSSNRTTKGNTIAQLLDTGNFILRQENNDDEDYLWQSFHYPTDTILPGMKLGWDRKTGLHRFLTSWRRPDDPSSGDFSFQLDVHGFPEFSLLNKGVRYYRSGPWNGLRFSGAPQIEPRYNISFYFKIDPDEVTYSFFATNKYLYSRVMVNAVGVLQRFVWIESSQIWNLFWYARKDQCDGYGECGVYGVCDTNWSPVCQCVKGFEPKNALAWNLRDGHDGCVRKKTKLNCVDDGFLKLENMKLPESSRASIDKEMSLGDCEEACRRNCSCTAYSSMDIRGGGSGCVIWATELVDLRIFEAVEGARQVLYVKVPAADLEKAESGGSKTSSGKSKTALIAGVTVGCVVLLLGLSLCFLWTRKKKPMVMPKIKAGHQGPPERSQTLFTSGTIKTGTDLSGEMTNEDLDLPLFDFGFIAMATDNFSKENRLGRGGFGIVYKGTTDEGDEIAVKRLSRNSGQGVEEFKNELRLIARLQHRNLVRLLGCCVEVEEKMLVYEYLENRSLDSILFKKEKCSLLDWQKRFNIICGIAKGLVYLHEDSRFRIIHRDLKASNILLDKEMIPKISDFGMARIFGGDETEGNTKRIVGTYGYMSPEYAMDGLFSVKSDVFSFGVLVLEIVSGQKNKGFYNADEELNLLGHAYMLWREERGLELLDSCIGDLFSSSEVMRCVQIGLLCVQERAEDRPTMSTVVFMLSSENTLLPQPKHPGFVLGRRSPPDLSSNIQYDSCTVNHVTVTMLDGR